MAIGYNTLYYFIWFNSFKVGFFALLLYLTKREIALMLPICVIFVLSKNARWGILSEVDFQLIDVDDSWARCVFCFVRLVYFDCSRFAGF